MTRQKRFLAALLACGLAFVMLFSLFFIALETDHDCHEDDCAICAVLSICENLLRDLSCFIAAAAVVLGAERVVHAYRGCLFSARPSVTLVSLKIKLSD